MKYLDQIYPKDKRTYTPENCKSMINYLNENMFIYKTSELVNNEENKDIKALYTNEAKAIALEYLTKLDLLSQHTLRITYFRNMFEMSLSNLMNINETKFNENLAMYFEHDRNYSQHNNIINANKFFKTLFNDPYNNLADISNKLAELFNILPNLSTSVEEVAPLAEAVIATINAAQQGQTAPGRVQGQPQQIARQGQAAQQGGKRIKKRKL